MKPFNFRAALVLVSLTALAPGGAVRAGVYSSVTEPSLVSAPLVDGLAVDAAGGSAVKAAAVEVTAPVTAPEGMAVGSGVAETAAVEAPLLVTAPDLVAMKGVRSSAAQDVSLGVVTVLPVAPRVMESAGD